jgi:hypothetical protein
MASDNPNWGLSAPGAELVSPALAELGGSISSWLVAHGSRLPVDRMTFDGRSWTMDAATWSQTGPADGVLSLDQTRRSA